MYRILVWLVSFAYKIAFRYQLRGVENVRGKGPFIICPNHEQADDPFYVMFATSPERLALMAKHELFEYCKLFSDFLSWGGAFPVNRDKNGLSAVKTAIMALRKGKKVVIFPEGRRVHEGESHDPLGGVAMLALREKVPLLPVNIHRRKGFVWRKVIVTFGEPVRYTCEGKPDRADYDRVSQDLMDRIWALEPKK